MRKLSPSYDEYCNKLQRANEKFVEQYPEVFYEDGRRVTAFLKHPEEFPSEDIIFERCTDFITFMSFNL